MKISQQPTKHILIKANCNSKWDTCNFAIITCDYHWKKIMRERLEAAASFFADYDFNHFTYNDGSAEFYILDEDEMENMLTENEGKKWAFITLEQDEEQSFCQPESRLDAYSLVLYKDESGFYKAYGKHTGEEFYTAKLPFAEIMKSMQSPQESLDCGTNNIKAGEFQ